MLAFLLILALVLPWLKFIVRPGGASIGHALFWLALLFCLLLLWMLSTAQRRMGTALGPDPGRNVARG